MTSLEVTTQARSEEEECKPMFTDVMLYENKLGANFKVASFK